MRQTLILALILPGLVGCGSPYNWAHPDQLGANALTADRAQCRQLALQEDWRFYDIGRRSSLSSTFYSRSRGYRYEPFLSQRFNRSELRRDLEDFCLRSRGWELQPTESIGESTIMTPVSPR